ncbi:MAG: hypothetical protein NVS3B15_17960 [Sediminibacterium sp.]
MDTQRGYPRVANAIKQKEDTLKKQFAEAHLTWPLKQMYVRSFKYDSQMEVWVRSNPSEPFKLFKTYKICALSGTLGPKRITVGCIPIRDNIEELYLLASYARNQGQDFIPVHIFPIRYNVERSKEFLARASREDKNYQQFSGRLKEVFDYFELHKKLPLISINQKGEYVVL